MQRVLGLVADVISTALGPQYGPTGCQKARCADPSSLVLILACCLTAEGRLGQDGGRSRLCNGLRTGMFCQPSPSSCQPPQQMAFPRLAPHGKNLIYVDLGESGRIGAFRAFSSAGVTFLLATTRGKLSIASADMRPLSEPPAYI